MSFVVSARKYRPQNFDELVGQDHIAHTLKNALKSNQLAHAFLFSGPRGVGKTTCARILARVLNCENLQEDYKACGTCSSCKAFSENASFNIFELDAASNNSVDHIRALNEQVRFQPAQGAFKIYIIDEVHMLSSSAFNAFLKTLEEPPPYAKFILATTEKHKIIPTILSRCQIFDFRRIQIQDIVHQLSSIVAKENRTIDDEALHLIAQKADGAMRDALSIYDKIISSVEGDVSYKHVAENLNILDYEYYFRIIDAAVKEDFTQILMIYDEIVKNGFEAEQFVPGIMEHLRDLLMIKDLQTAQILEISDTLKSRYENQAQLTSESFLLTGLSIFNTTDINLVRSQNKRLSIEIALSKLALMNRAVDKKKTVTQAAKNLDQPSQSPDKISEKSTPIVKVQIAKPIKSESPLADVSQNKNETSVDVETSPSNDLESTKDALVEKQKYEAISSPMVSANLDSLLANIEKTENDKNQKSHPFTPDEISKIFDKSKNATESQSLKTALSFINISVEGNSIIIKTPTQIFIDFIKQELQLIEQIHDHFPGKDIKIQFEVSEETFPDYEPPKKPKMLTTKEKYDLLISKNPNFEKLVNEFKLKISNQ